MDIEQEIFDHALLLGFEKDINKSNIECKQQLEEFLIKKYGLYIFYTLATYKNFVIYHYYHVSFIGDERFCDILSYSEDKVEAYNDALLKTIYRCNNIEKIRDFYKNLC